MIRRIFCTIIVASTCFLTAPAQISAPVKHLGDSLLTKATNSAGLFSFKAANFLIPSNFASSQYGFFCRKELLLDKKTFIPLRFRLGNLEYCNKLEGKK